MLGRFSYTRTYKARPASLRDYFSSRVPDFSSDESDELIREAVKRAEDYGFSKRKIVLDEDARITKVFCRGRDKDVFWFAEYFPPEKSGNFPGRVEVTVTRKRMQQDAARQFYAYAHKIA